jgi:hypothetical protein
VAATNYGIMGNFVARNGEDYGWNSVIFLHPSCDTCIPYVRYSAFAPSVAYNSASMEYFVVWQDKSYSGNEFDIIGQRVKPDFIASGYTVGGHIGVAMEGSCSRFIPDIVYNPHSDEYAVAYNYAFTDDDHDIKVQRLSPSGTRRGGETAIAAWTKWEGRPAISYNHRTSEYLIAYEYEYSATDHDVRVQRMTNYGARIGNPAWVAVSVNWERSPDLVYNPVNNEYLAVYEYAYSADDHDIRGRRLSAYGGGL